MLFYKNIYLKIGPTIYGFHAQYFVRKFFLLRFFLFCVTRCSTNFAEKRITRCEQLLLNTDMTLSEVAYECGYADLPTMSKAFKRKYGFPPSKFRVYKDAKKLMQMHEKPMK